MWNCVKISYAFLEQYKNLIIENILQNFNDRYLNNLYITNNQCDVLIEGKFGHEKWRA